MWQNCDNCIAKQINHPEHYQVIFNIRINKRNNKIIKNVVTTTTMAAERCVRMCVVYVRNVLFVCAQMWTSINVCKRKSSPENNKRRRRRQEEEVSWVFCCLGLLVNIKLLFIHQSHIPSMNGALNDDYGTVINCLLTIFLFLLIVVENSNLNFIFENVLIRK